MLINNNHDKGWVLKREKISSRLSFFKGRKYSGLNFFSNFDFYAGYIILFSNLHCT